MDQNQAKNAKKNENFFSLRLPFKLLVLFVCLFVCICLFCLYTDLCVLCNYCILYIENGSSITG